MQLLESSATARAFRGVALGITLDELRRVRPGISAAPYVGMSEVVGNDTVWYRFAERARQGEASERSLLPVASGPAGQDRLVGVEIVTPDPKRVEARRLTAATRRKHSGVCVRYQNGPIPVHGVIGRSDSVLVAILHWSSHELADARGRSPRRAKTHSHITYPRVLIPSHVVVDTVRCD